MPDYLQLLVVLGLALLAAGVLSERPSLFKLAALCSGTLVAGLSTLLLFLAR